MKFDISFSEFWQPKSNKKIKIYLAIGIPMIIIIIIIALTVNKSNKLKNNSKNDIHNEIYNVDIKISRNTYHIYYFIEKKTINTRVGFTNGVKEEHEFSIFTNFIILQTDKKELENNKFLNNATLVILDAKINYKNEQKELTNFDIFNKSFLNEFKANLNGIKYPMALFSFYENGTIIDIKVPDNMDNYNANNIMEIIENIIPKLSRNKTEDSNNGINVTTKKENKKNILLESQTPKERKEFKGSLFSKMSERNVENEQLINIISNSNLTLKTQKKEEQADFGLEDYYCEQKTEIISTGVKKKKDNYDLINNYAEYYTFIDIKDLI